ncbi:MAG: hypothetical protein EPO24_10925 [Bacteroidetes bacterium]|nr:MAG: hypothetical protein EPO24_10925 [Bacteroidota bacterium]
MKKLTFLIFLLFIGCSPSVFHGYVVQRDVPQNPSFVVIPASDYYDEIAYANKMEACLIRLGLKVVTRPGQKFVVTEKGTAKANLNNENSETELNAGGLGRTEKYWALDSTSADYYIHSFLELQQIKVVKKSTKEVLTIFSTNIKPRRMRTKEVWENHEILIHDAFESLGFSVKAIDTVETVKRIK